MQSWWKFSDFNSSNSTISSSSSSRGDGPLLPQGQQFSWCDRRHRGDGQDGDSSSSASGSDIFQNKIFFFVNPSHLFRHVSSNHALKLDSSRMIDQHFTHVASGVLPSFYFLSWCISPFIQLFYSTKWPLPQLYHDQLDVHKTSYSKTKWVHLSINGTWLDSRNVKTAGNGVSSQ